MKKKTSSLTYSKRMNEFRYHELTVNKNGKKKKIKHPSYIWQERGNLYDYHSITHSKEIDGVKLKKLRCNPNPSDKRDSYYDIDSKSDIKSSFGRKRKKWRLDILDKKDIHNK